MKYAVLASFQIEGFHCWPDAPKVVEFLRSRHRHKFYIEMEREVTHADRDVEIILLGRAARATLAERFSEPCEFGTLSCEAIAEVLVSALHLRSCKVLEDGENGAIAYAGTDTQ